MLIDKIDIPLKELTDFSLKEIKMNRLGRFVTLAGKNGSGKSRILGRVNYYVNYRDDWVGSVRKLKEDNEYIEKTLISTPGGPSIEANLRMQINENMNKLKQIDERIFPKNLGQRFRAIYFVPNGLGLADPRLQSAMDTNNRAKSASALGINDFNDRCICYMQVAQDIWWNTSHQEFEGPEEERLSALDNYTKLKSIVNRMVGGSLSRTSAGEVTLFDKPICDASLSNGQKIILQMCVAIHAQAANLDNLVILLDEPENHLHPSAAIELLEALYSAAPNAQLWIATHSIPLLSYVAFKEPMSLWFVEDGCVANAGRYPERVLESLLGNEERQDYLSSFTALPAQLAAITYARECLFAPGVIPASEFDPQVSQAQTVFSKLRGNNPLRVLDFGAGKGRLLAGVGDICSSDGVKVDSLIDYFAIDQSAVDASECRSIIELHFGVDKKRYFYEDNDFFSVKDDGSIDVVVMCNVLHEISPSDWIDIFSDQSLIRRALGENGHLLLVEDQRIPIGEKAHEFGFIVMDTNHLKTAFSISEDDIKCERFVVYDARSDGRLKAHLIEVSLLSRMSEATIKAALQQLKKTSKDKIKELRKEEPSYANGLSSGFWVQQFANTSIFLGE